ncbi:MAG: MFS transporter [Gemmatimonadales bacterium]
MLGRLSDRVGRRPVLLVTILFSCAGYLIFAFAGSYPVLFVARLISGFAAGNISAAQAYIADVTPAADRSRAMGLIGVAFGLGFTLGPGLGGLSAHYGGPTAPGLVAAALSLVNFGSVYLILPESLGLEHRVGRSLFDLGHLRDALARRRLRPLMLIWLIVPFAFAGYTVALPLYTGAAFGWRERELGSFFTLVGITAATVQGYVFGQLAKRVPDRTLVVVGTFGMVLGIGVVPFLGSAASIYGWTILLAFSNSIMAPATSGLISKIAGPTEQGAILGAAQAFGALGRFAGPEAVGGMYDGFGSTAAFLGAALVMVVAGLASLQIEPPTVSKAPATGPGPGEGDHAGAP